MEVGKIHLIKGRGINVAWHYPANELIPLSDSEFEHFCKKSEDDFASTKKSNGLNTKVNDALENKNLQDNVKKESNKRKIKRITLCVSNDCDLRCKYCYAGGGSYGQIRKLMDKDTAQKFIDFCIKEFDYIEYIVFFGGEPFLNLSVMEFVCSQFKSKYKEGSSKLHPKFSAVTNGTILNPATVSFINDYLDQLTVSIDGPQQINDANRYFINGKGTFSIISKFIDTIKVKTTVDISYEATLTDTHIREGFDYKSISEYLHERFGISGVVLDELKVDTSYLMNYLDSIDKKSLIESDFENLPTDFWEIFYSLTKKEDNNICMVINKKMSISTDGTIYSCHMLNGQKNCSLGEIDGPNVYNDRDISENFKSQTELQNNIICDNCWCRHFCGGCAVSSFFDKKEKRFKVIPNEFYCEQTKKITEKALLLIAYMKMNKELWAMLLNKLKKDL